MNWTTEIPKEDGLYWWKPRSNDRYAPSIVRIRDAKTDPRLMFFDIPNREYSPTGLFYPQPIQPPEE